MIKILDCTLRDGAYIVNGDFGVTAIKGIISKLTEAQIDIIECGWLKNDACKNGSTYYHIPDDLNTIIGKKTGNVTYVVMIDWNRYDLSQLPERSGDTIDAIRVVFPKDKYVEGIAVAREIKEKGYDVYLQAANTMAYSDEEIHNLVSCTNSCKPVSLSIVDTFGEMHAEDLRHIVTLIDGELDGNIGLGFHSHNNQQMSFALSIEFIETLSKGSREIIVDSSLCGMGRGAGNATTELLVSYINKKHNGYYDLNVIMDAIDMYMVSFQERYQWGYSTSYFIAGVYGCHVNNIAYLLKNHRCNGKDMKNVIESLPEADRKKYDYDLLESKFIEYQSNRVDDTQAIATLKETIGNKKVLLIAPGKSIIEEQAYIKQYIEDEKPVVIGVNAICDKYSYDYIFFANKIRYEYAKEIYTDIFKASKKILLSNIRTKAKDNEYLINYDKVIKRGWEHFDNAVIVAMRLISKLEIEDVAIAGFDGFKHAYNDSYADESLPTLNPDNKWDELNEEIRDMYQDFRKSLGNRMRIKFITESYFE
ncbi:MAG: aldolase catalytic domain-containing protein [Eubacterium sp.]|nr:aldolase catalytic domain-containing protein [Eubacterium sp.]